MIISTLLRMFSLKSTQHLRISKPPNILKGKGMSYRCVVQANSVRALIVVKGAYSCEGSRCANVICDMVASVVNVLLQFPARNNPLT